ncbi:hypothetical protein SAMCCGM7_Ch1339 [Sinorhizobium americanum CCGM7]|nr:hypothetical protein SAMCCGM7_Ch1339 [Sinorhizobium americanum CCGM7]
MGSWAPRKVAPRLPMWRGKGEIEIGHLSDHPACVVLR